MTTFSVVLHNDIYDKLALMEARRAYADYAKVRTERVSPNVQKLTISVENRTDEEAREIIISLQLNSSGRKTVNTASFLFVLKDWVIKFFCPISLVIL